jgi:Holliday junction resolvasome RuvABC endonuclease subunit
MGSKGKVFNIAENTGVLKYKLFRSGIPLSIYPPSSVKKFATDKGNAKKEDMYKSFVKETKKQIMYALSPKAKKVSNPVSDVVDSYYICKMLYKEISERRYSK